MNYLPIALRISGRKVVVVGAGKVAQRKVKTLVAAGAKVTLVAPQATPALKRLAQARRIKWLRRPIAKSDLSRANLVISATNQAAVNARISQWARQKKIAVNVVDKPGLSDFISPAILKKGLALIAVYTDGKDPVLSRDLKNYLGDNWDDFLLFRHRP
ncbi:MAG: bifunctional precorrin-2 dehydrogenase/sirohydrochlorin ferrochelatase [Candidatus Omnitrophica bacterium]|nr:bifunctional precorrin-2 dehydrogenase/sirohydrochlorin ferrochelatase [Candidatus Omnitrophota bacterium]MBU2043625.1 bifunctional precorrin-2 dehydrogenase/sirohydrochlorin ferrochelatase [Candidatus Omnitrophota bacterium]MBU2265558.1 bifunctional precorrin-2 dehydrogenase/sirohydrochlorin ferrochelatase [Candidatus Omnitrophota bacterium]